MKTFRNIGETYLVSNNKVDKDVQSMLLPLNLMQHIMFCPKYRIKDNVITPNTLSSNVFSLIATLILMFLYIRGTYLVAISKDSIRLINFDYVTFFYGCVFYCFGFAMNFVVGIIGTKNHVQFVLTFQKVHRLLNNGTSCQFIIWNWILGIVALSYYVIVFTYFISQIGVPLYIAYVCYLTVVFDLNVVYASRLIQMLKNKVILWNFQVLNSQELENTNRENYNQKIFQAYVHILECYDIYKISFQPFILFHIYIVINCLCYAQVAIETFQKGIMINNMYETIMRSMSVLSWYMKNLMWETILIKQCEKFYSALQGVQDTCTLILKSTRSDDEKRLCKNVLRLHRASFSKIRVCGLFYLDAALQLSLMSLLTNYTIVLLQLAFL